ncbi:FixH family protein [Noviherbaspirillum autotrophicum]|uniref:Cytochrome oxidase assembly protein n=1 Tax=Noviherbaspirillum autotrophicum TaxID=709839 RepID=A0A0C1Y319_9BURK|nr:FixH family protein [Noviherbaspirillum autotrophicum]KIF81478.1 cytochrome oxidase assembly protein [Noviherbaspirillum autotrophicum]
MQSANPTLKADDGTPWYANRWPWFLMLGPFLVVVAGCFTAWLAVTRSDALVVDDYYKQGKAINQDLRRDRVAADLQLNVNVRFDPAAGKLIGHIDSPHRPVAGKLAIRLVHSTLPEKDIVREVQPDSQGNFAVDLAFLEQAHWQVQVEDQARDWRLTGAWSWPKQRDVVLRPDLAPAEG